MSASPASANVAPLVTSKTMPRLTEELSQARRKIQEDVLRFRTCCADPRASK